MAMRLDMESQNNSICIGKIELLYKLYLVRNVELICVLENIHKSLLYSIYSQFWKWDKVLDKYFQENKLGVLGTLNQFFKVLINWIKIIERTCSATHENYLR